jgi:hypothetical protein
MNEPQEPYYIMLRPDSWPSLDQYPNLLGKIVKNFYSPFDNYTPAFSEIYNRQNLIVHGPLEDFKLDTDSHHQRGAQGQANIVARLNIDFSESTTGAIVGKAVWAVRLQQLDECFQSVVSQQATREKLSDWLPRLTYNKAYYIAGLLVAEDLSILQAASSDSSTSANVDVPVSSIAQVVAGSPMTIPFGDLNAGISRHEQTLQSISGRANGSRIVAIDCRVVRRRRFHNAHALCDQNPHASGARKHSAGRDGAEYGGDDLVLGETHDLSRQSSFVDTSFA